MKLLALIAALVIIGGVIATFIDREHALNRVEHLERVVRCEDSPECREFVRRAIREILRHRGEEKRGKGGRSVTFRLGTVPLGRPAPLLVEEDAPEPEEPSLAEVSPSRPQSPQGGGIPDKPAKTPREAAQNVSEAPEPEPPPPSPGPGPPPPPDKPGRGAPSVPPGKEGQAIIEAPELPVTVCVPPVVCPPKEGD